MSNQTKIKSISELNLISSSIMEDFLPLHSSGFKKGFVSLLEYKKKALSNDLVDSNLIPKDKLNEYIIEAYKEAITLLI